MGEERFTGELGSSVGGWPCEAGQEGAFWKGHGFAEREEEGISHSGSRW
jgi:hypothetical protein